MQLIIGSRQSTLNILCKVKVTTKGSERAPLTDTYLLIAKVCPLQFRLITDRSTRRGRQVHLQNTSSVRFNNLIVMFIMEHVFLTERAIRTSYQTTNSHNGKSMLILLLFFLKLSVFFTASYMHFVNHLNMALSCRVCYESCKLYFAVPLKFPVN